ncbi:MAG: nitrous oxide reductase family maturation protein NosD [Brumimicrobium sp.]|nr:nitrous oxide reductase family maturation protein NosD [Brumimicrobium sp.]MCO5268020.1 nitrous oxide reductase family maturation protein NosD [Brumimicrobium sp.]
MANLFRIYFFILILFYGFYTHAEIIVCKTCETKTITEGIKKAKPYQKVIVKAGIYYENFISIDKPIKLITEEKATIDGKKKGDIIIINSDNVTVDGFKLINVGSSYTNDYAAIRVNKYQNFIIQNLDLKDIFFGIYLAKSRNGIVRNNVIHANAENEYNSGNGIHLWYAKKININNNLINQARDGIYLEFSDSCRITYNRSKGNLRYGLHFMFANDNIYIGNTFESSGAGVAVMFSKNVTMIRNRFKKNWGAAAYGLLLKELHDSKIENNTFEENTTGINVENCNRITYTNNNFIGNGWAAKVNGACYKNVFSGNNFINNSFDISYTGRLNDNVFTKNYWSKYTGYDLDKNGLGDVPYRPVKLFNYVVDRVPQSIILLRSLFIDIIEFSENVSPTYTPDNLFDDQPLMKQNKW